MALEGVAQLTRQLDALGKLEDGKALQAGVRAAIKSAKQRAEALIPVGVDEHRTHKGRLVAPGFAKRNIKVKVSTSRDKQRATASLGVSSEAYYAVQFVELGTSEMPAHPWLRPAFESTQSAQQQGLAASLRKSIEKAARTK